MRYTFVIGLVVACAYALALNAGVIVMMSRGSASPAFLGIQRASADEAHYFARMREFSEGRLAIGNVALKEHRDAWETAQGSGAAVQGALLAFTGWEIQTIVWIGDVLFPFLAALLVFWITCALFINAWIRIAVTILILNVIGVGWLRSVSPQVTMTIFFAFLGAFLCGSVREWKLTLIRGVLIALLAFVQPQYAVLCAVIEGLNLLRLLFLKRYPLSELLKKELWLIVPCIVAFVVKLLLLRVSDVEMSTDTYRRLGLIASHLPAAPVLQLQLLLGLGALFWLRTRVATKDRETSEQSDTLCVLLAAGLVSLNQSVVHGKDAIFGLYYTYPLLSILWLSGCFFVVHSVPSRKLAFFVLSSLTILSLVRFGERLQETVRIQKVEADAIAEAGILPVVMWLDSLPGERVIGAPIEIADLVPVFTDHYVLFNRYARFQTVGDKELAERYILQEILFPSPKEFIDPTHSLVFGQAPGNLAARKRTWCRIISLFQKSIDECRVEIRSMVTHQELLPMLDEKRADRLSLLQKYHVDTIVTASPLPAPLIPFCNQNVKIGTYTVYLCNP